jgi:N-methylhydantoinase A
LAFKITVDTGGTFTDAVVTDAEGRVTIGKALTTYSRVSEGLLAAVDVAAKQLGMSGREMLGHTSLLIYGTTIATNAVATRRIAKTALLVTQGCREMLSIRQGGSPSIRETSEPYPGPYIPRRHTFEVKERINAEGNVETALDEAALQSTLNEIREKNFEAVAVSLLWSMTNTSHEQRVGALIRKDMSGLPYTLSHELLPVIREYPRTVTTAIDASLKPVVERDLGRLEGDLRKLGYGGALLVSTSLGGCMEIGAALEQPIYLLRSGPAMAPVAAQTVALQENAGSNALVCDTGGTTFDVGLVLDRDVSVTKETWLGKERLGEQIGLPMVDIRSLGAGGGSIAWVDEGGMMHVGPQSAKSEPGPACYGRGGAEATVTDAAVVLGYIDPDNFLGGAMELDVDAAQRAVDALAQQLEMSRLDTAFGIFRIVNENMMGGIANITVSEGLDPREAAFVAGGGGAGLNILAIARDLGCKQVILPPTAGVLSAFGMQVADIKSQFSVSAFSRSVNFDYAGAKQAFDTIRTQLEGFASKVSAELAGAPRMRFFAGTRYPMQITELDVAITKCPENDTDLADLIEAYHKAHERIYAHRDAGSPIEVVYWKGELTIEIDSDHIAVASSTRAAQIGSAKSKKSREAFFGGDAPVDTQIYLSRDLGTGAKVMGPAIVVEPTTTIVVYPNMTLKVSKAGNYICETGA